MNITTTYKTNGSGRSQIVAKGIGGRQKTTNFDSSRSTDWNHGTAAANLIIHTQAVAPELQYGDSIVSAAVRSIDSGSADHDSNDSGTVHRFSV